MRKVTFFNKPSFVSFCLKIKKIILKEFKLYSLLPQRSRNIICCLKELWISKAKPKCSPIFELKHRVAIPIPNVRLEIRSN